VIAFHEDSPDPEDYRSDIFTESADSRRRLLKALGMESSPELHALWERFLKEHPEKSEEKILSESVSGGLLPNNLRRTKLDPLDLDIGFEDASENPIEIRAFYRLNEGHWRHVATLACNCQMYERDDPPFLLAGQAVRTPEYVVSLDRHDELQDDHRQEIRFLWKDDVLHPLIEFESMRIHCPQGVSYSPACTVVETSLEKTNLVDNNGKIVPGFALISWSGNPPKCDMCGLILRNPKCTAYLWDETVFAYVPSTLKLKACGSAADSGKQDPLKAHAR
jgi:hypothetical protein